MYSDASGWQLSPHNEFTCTPQCLFDVTGDPSEQNNLNPLSYAREMNLLNAVLNSASASYVPVLSSGICAAGWFPGNVVSTTDALAQAAAVNAGFWTSWT